jgi:hypothetical protein
VTISTIGLLGDSKVDITRGSEAGTVIEDGGTIQGSEEGDVRRIVQGANDVVANFQSSAKISKKSPIVLNAVRVPSENFLPIPRFTTTLMAQHENSRLCARRANRTRARWAV